jgi:predicted kinase
VSFWQSLAFSCCCRVVLLIRGVMSQSRRSDSHSQYEEPFPCTPAAVPAGTDVQRGQARQERPVATQDRHTATMLLIVGLPGAGKTTRAIELAAANRAMRLTPDHWMIPLFGDSMAGGKRWVLEGRLISVALQALRLGTSAVLDFGLWGRDERSALRWLARAAGASCRVVYLPVDRDVQLARIAHRQATVPHQTFPMSEADVDQWREQFQVPDSAELDGGEIPNPPAGWPGWEWAEDHWPSCTDC